MDCNKLLHVYSSVKTVDMINTSAANVYCVLSQKTCKLKKNKTNKSEKYI